MLKYAELSENQVIGAEENNAITKQQLKEYAVASGDLNPLHTDDAVAQRMGLPGVIAHGMLVMGQLGKYVNHLAGNQAVIQAFNMRFGAMTFPEDAITCSAIIQSISNDQVVLTVYASKGSDEIVGTGKATLYFEGEAV